MDQQPDDRPRVSALKGYGVLDTPNEAEFDQIVKEAARLLKTPIALISLLDENRQWFKAKVGSEAIVVGLRHLDLTSVVEDVELHGLQRSAACRREKGNHEHGARFPRESHEPVSVHRGRRKRDARLGIVRRAYRRFIH